MTPPMQPFPPSALPQVGRLNAVRALSRALRLVALLSLVALVVTPWQQSVRGSGRVIAYAPVERQQAVEAPIDGRVIHWFVQEGDRVKRGEPIAELTDNDAEILARVRRERDAAQSQVDAADVAVQLTEARIASLELANGAALENARLRVQMATDRRIAAEQALQAASAELSTAQLNLTRQQRLHERGLSSTRDLELSILAAQTAQAGSGRAQAALRAARVEVKALTADLAEKGSSNRADIDSARSSLEKLKAEAAKAAAELSQVQVKLARQEQMLVTAPRDGTIFRVVANQGAEMVKAGDPLVLLVPEVGSRAVELYVDGNDAPLIAPGRPVRLQFEGWPAVQFMGWPSVAVGTFSGRVAFVDAHGDGRGRFRVVVVPQDVTSWPDRRYLRQGVRANGWLLLNQVSLGFELWRQFNGFPPALHPVAHDDSESVENNT